MLTSTNLQSDKQYFSRSAEEVTCSETPAIKAYIKLGGKASDTAIMSLSFTESAEEQNFLEHTH